MKICVCACIYAQIFIRMYAVHAATAGHVFGPACSYSKIMEDLVMGLNKKSVDDINVNGKRVLVRCDFNVPLKNGEITEIGRAHV